MKRERIYISGPISNLDRSDYLGRFAEAEKQLAAQGFRVVNPTKFMVCKHPRIYALLGYKWTLLYDLWRLSHCDCVYMLKGWLRSGGAKVENNFAAALGKTILYESKLEKKDGKK